MLPASHSVLKSSVLPTDFGVLFSILEDKAVKFTNNAGRSPPFLSEGIHGRKGTFTNPNAFLGVHTARPAALHSEQFSIFSSNTKISSI
jgi:hypothetical protein